MEAPAARSGERVDPTLEPMHLRGQELGIAERARAQAPLRHLDEWTPRETLRYRLEVTRVR
jgi:hypothetical protein